MVRSYASQAVFHQGGWGGLTGKLFLQIIGLAPPKIVKHSHNSILYYLPLKKISLPSLSI